MPYRCAEVEPEHCDTPDPTSTSISASDDKIGTIEEFVENSILPQVKVKIELRRNRGRSGSFHWGIITIPLADLKKV
tara:strand:+ start:1273 stop:1503 length:231 start_codon:yes stop_codon:yes gene_type:complete